MKKQSTNNLDNDGKKKQNRRKEMDQKTLDLMKIFLILKKVTTHEKDCFFGELVVSYINKKECELFEFLLANRLEDFREKCALMARAGKAVDDALGIKEKSNERNRKVH